MPTSITYFPLEIIIIMAFWLIVGFLLIRKKPIFAYCFLAIYILLATQSCLRDIENSGYKPGYDFSIKQFIEKTENKEFQYEIIKYNESEYLRARPWSSNNLLFNFYSIYRLVLGYAFFPEYVFDKEGNVVAFSLDSQDDISYQESWGRAQKVKDISRIEFVNKIIKTET